jgi:hypothetical protein
MSEQNNRIAKQVRRLAVAVQFWLRAILHPDVGQAISVRLFSEAQVSPRSLSHSAQGMSFLSGLRFHS